MINNAKVKPLLSRISHCEKYFLKLVWWFTTIPILRSAKGTKGKIYF
jgi:hypothetical protein